MYCAFNRIYWTEYFKLKQKEAVMKYAMLRFYDGGGLATYEICNTKEEDLDEALTRFEEDCVSQNLGTRLAVLDEKEIINIAKAVKEEI